MSTQAKQAPSFPAIGGRVAHGQYGAGTVTALDIYHTVIDFDGHGPRRFVTHMVVLEQTTDPGPTPAERRATELRRLRAERARNRATAREAS